MKNLGFKACRSRWFSDGPVGPFGDSRESSSREVVLPAVASRLAEALDDSSQLPSEGTVSLIRERLEQHPHFRGRAFLLQIEQIGESIVVSGRLPNYYLKQLLQETIKSIPDVDCVDNRVEVLPGS